jgi:hypothetical protein
MSHAASAAILVRPTGFGHDPGTAATNAFQRPVDGPEVRRNAAIEFDELLQALNRCGVRTTVLDPVDPTAPNAVFPNNWFTTHADGTLVYYPMLTPSRRRERDPDLAAALGREGYRVRRTLDLSPWEDAGHILEGTGSLVLDRRHRTAFACLSPRTHARAVVDWCGRMAHRPVMFTATMDGTPSGQPVYHTNVVMTMGTGFAMVCLEAVPDEAERVMLVREIESIGRQVIPITLEQMHGYGGNALELRGTGGQAFLFIGASAHAALGPDQRMALQRHVQPVPVAIPTIEAVGGGGVRCMIAENFLPGA